MKIAGIRLFGAATIFALFVTGCGLAPVSQGQAITLGPNEGVAAVVMDTLDPLQSIMFQGTDKDGATLRISSVPKGVTLNLFVVPAGHYCLTQFSLGGHELDQNDTEHGVCFDVIAGQTAYSGNLAPRAYGPNNLRTDQNYDWVGIKRKLQADYPEVVAKYALVTP